MEWFTADPDGIHNGTFKFSHIHSLKTLESGSYWPQLRPFFFKPEYQRIRYSILGKSASKPPRRIAVSVRGASKAGELDVAFVSDHLAARMSIADQGLPDYCLTSVTSGQLTFATAGSSRHDIDPATGLIYRGSPDMTLSSAGPQERIAIWIPHASMKQRLCAFLDAPVDNDVEFGPIFDWNAPSSQGLCQLVRLMMIELRSSKPTVLGNASANKSFADLLIYTLLRSVKHNFSEQIERPNATPSPKILRNAENYIRENIQEPIALHEVAAAAGCSVRCLQLAFRKFKQTTPLLAIRQIRLEAAHKALRSGDSAETLTSVAQRFGFSNLGRFKRFYEATFGEAPIGTKVRRGE